MTDSLHYDMLIIGSGPAGQKAAIQASKAGKRVAVIEKNRAVGGACVHHGTIPSKTLRETTVALAGFRQRSGHCFPIEMPQNLMVASLMNRLQEVVSGHEHYIGDQLVRNGIECLHGRARFVGPHEVEVQAVTGTRTVYRADIIFVAVGSKPREAPEVAIDHENILDSDSILSLLYLPQSLTVLGAGVIASEYASIFATLGVQVTMIDRYPRPLGFLDPELTDRFLASFEERGGRYLPNRTPVEVVTDGFKVTTRLDDGQEIVADKALCALGRIACLDGLNIEAAGLEVGGRGILDIDENCRTAVPHIYAIGDVAGRPALAASSMEQGRRAACHALGLEGGPLGSLIPMGIYTIPEMSAVGMSEAEAHEKLGGVLLGRARFQEIARGHIAGIKDGLLKMVADPAGEKFVGVHIVGEGATELIHLGQMGLLHGGDIDLFVENIFNFPTLAEAYRVAALDIAEQRAALGHAAAAD